MGKALLGAFWPGRDTGACELRGWAGTNPPRCGYLAFSGRANWIRESVGVVVGKNRKERAEAAGANDSSGETRKTTAT